MDCNSFKKSKKDYKKVRERSVEEVKEKKSQQVSKQYKNPPKYKKQS